MTIEGERFVEHVAEVGRLGTTRPPRRPHERNHGTAPVLRGSRGRSLAWRRPRRRDRLRAARTGGPWRADSLNGRRVVRRRRVGLSPRSTLGHRPAGDAGTRGKPPGSGRRWQDRHPRAARVGALVTYLHMRERGPPTASGAGDAYTPSLSAVPKPMQDARKPDRIAPGRALLLGAILESDSVRNRREFVQLHRFVRDLRVTDFR